MWKYCLIIGLAFAGCNSAGDGDDVAETSPATFTVRAEALDTTGGVKDCMRLDVTEDDILSVIAQSKRARGPEFHYNHVYPPCRHLGQIEYEGNILSYSFYPTGYLSLEGYEGWFMCYDCTVHPEWTSFDNQGEE